MYTDHCPTLRQIHDIVKPEVSGVTARWYDLGVQLLDEDAGVLDTIQTNHPTDASVCCNQMFKKWLQMQSKANWNQLITALIKINLNAVAESVSNLILKGKILVVTYCIASNRLVVTHKFSQMHCGTYFMRKFRKCLQGSK